MFQRLSDGGCPSPPFIVSSAEGSPHLGSSRSPAFDPVAKEEGPLNVLSGLLPRTRPSACSWLRRCRTGCWQGVAGADGQRCPDVAARAEVVPAVGFRCRFCAGPEPARRGPSLTSTPGIESLLQHRQRRSSRAARPAAVAAGRKSVLAYGLTTKACCQFAREHPEHFDTIAACNVRFAHLYCHHASALPPTAGSAFCRCGKFRRRRLGAGDRRTACAACKTGGCQGTALRRCRGDAAAGLRDRGA